MVKEAPPSGARTVVQLSLKYYKTWPESSVITSPYALSTQGEYLKPKSKLFTVIFIYYLECMLNENLESKDMSAYDNMCVQIDATLLARVVTYNSSTSNYTSKKVSLWRTVGEYFVFVFRVAPAIQVKISKSIFFSRVLRLEK